MNRRRKRKGEKGDLWDELYQDPSTKKATVFNQTMYQ